jgi:hypothetical protein
MADIFHIQVETTKIMCQPEREQGEQTKAHAGYKTPFVRLRVTKNVTYLVSLGYNKIDGNL